MEDGIRDLREKIVYEYVESTSTFTMLILVCIFGALAFTVFKVMKLVQKAHMF